MNTIRRSVLFLFGLAFAASAGATPSITSQPSGNGAPTGQTMTFNVGASSSGGLTLSYQWFQQDPNTLVNTPLTDGTLAAPAALAGEVISGSTTAQLTISNLPSGANGDIITVKVTDTGGSVTSNGNSTMTVFDEGVFWDTDIFSDKSVAAGGTVSFSVAAEGGPLPTFQWRKTVGANSPVNLSSGLQSSGSTISIANVFDSASQHVTSTLTISNATAGDAGRYDVVASNIANGSPSSATSSATFGNLTVTKADQSAPVINSATTKIYGAAYTATVSTTGFGLTWSLGTGSTASGAAINSSTGAVSSNGVGTVVIKALYAGDAGHNASPSTANFTITVGKAPLTVTAANKQRLYGVNNPAFTVGYSGFVGSDSATSLTTQPTATSTATLASVAGLYPITAAGGVSSNYTFSYVAGTLTITRPATGDFNGDNKSDFAWSNTATGERAVWLMNGTAFSSNVSLGTVSTDWQIAAIADFNGDGKQDIVWQNTSTGARLIWLMNGTAFSSSVSLGTVSTDWQIAAAGDFNNDGKPDLLWQNTVTGARSVWLMNGTSFSSSVALSTMPIQWQIVAAADFSGDGRTDIVWQNTVTGKRSIWLMNGTTYQSSVSLGTVSTRWSIAGTGDYNGDGKPDLILQNTVTGERSVWLMNGTTISSEVSAGTVDPVWTIGRTSTSAPAAADFNADGDSDILWQNTATGDRLLWLMNGTSFSSGVDLGTISTQWQIAAIGDFNADGQPDILWQNTSTGERLIWLMNGTAFGSSVSLGTVATQWSIAGTGDFNGDGQTDILWQNTTTGDRAIWLMNGTAFGSSVSLGNIPTQWSIAGAGDFTGDGQTDILWQNTSTGARTVWAMNGSVFSATVSLGTVATQWSIAGTGDFNGDGQTDILWQNTTTGDRVIWLMNGTTFISSIALGNVPVAWSIRN
jgi:hypothetical protein